MRCRTINLCHSRIPTIDHEITVICGDIQATATAGVAVVNDKMPTHLHLHLHLHLHAKAKAKAPKNCKQIANMVIGMTIGLHDASAKAASPLAR